MMFRLGIIRALRRQGGTVLSCVNRKLDLRQPAIWGDPKGPSTTNYSNWSLQVVTSHLSLRATNEFNLQNDSWPLHL